MLLTTGPIITCLMVTKNRLLRARHSIRCYLRQSYRSRNLIIVDESGESEKAKLRDLITRLNRTDIRIVPIERDTLSLGALRNVSVAEANGELICQWDDDDLYHPYRLSAQVSALMKQGGRACFMTDQLQFVEKLNSIYWCDWSRPKSRPDWPRAIPNTLMCERSHAVPYPETGQESRRSEDTTFMFALAQHNQISLLKGMGVLYMYVTHETNTWDEQHHLHIPEIAGMDRPELVEREEVLKAALTHYPVQYPVYVRDSSHQIVFTIAINGTESARA